MEEATATDVKSAEAPVAAEPGVSSSTSDYSTTNLQKA